MHKTNIDSRALAVCTDNRSLHGKRAYVIKSGDVLLTNGLFQRCCMDNWITIARLGWWTAALACGGWCIFSGLVSRLPFSSLSRSVLCFNLSLFSLLLSPFSLLLSPP